ncbi:MAG: alpha/beta hydrolase [Marinomonas sp.]
MKRILKTLAVMAVIFAAVFLVFRTSDTQVSEMKAKYGGVPSQFVTLPNGQQIHLRDEGPTNAPAIILLHGSSSDLHTWEPWVQALKSDYRVIRYDQIGHGLTGPSIAESYELADFTGDVGRVADHLDLETFVLAGNSMGGWISAGYALEHPERLKGLVLLDASGSPVKRPENSGGNIGFTIAATPGLNNIMKHITPRSLVKQSLEQSVSVKAVATDEAVDRYWEMLRYPGNRAATIARFNTQRVTYDAEQIGGLNVPTLILWGTEDALVPVEAGRWYDEHLPSSTLIEYDGIGHLPMEEAPEKSANDLKNWLVNAVFKQETP